MPNTPIEKSYVEQGYTLPKNITWDMVATERARLDIAHYMVPVALAAGCCAWSVPHVDGKPLKWRHLV